MLPKRIYGLASLREAAREMLKAIDKFERGIRAEVPPEKLEEFREAMKKIEEGCETFLKIQFKGEGPNTPTDKPNP